MRLWHQDLISKLPKNQLGGQWRECIALLGNGWGRKHSTVNYVFNYDESKLIAYSNLIANERLRRGYKANTNLILTALEKRLNTKDIIKLFLKACEIDNENIYQEHNEDYLKECLENLKSKGITI